MSENPENSSSIDQEEQNYSLQEDVVHLEQLLADSRLECVDLTEKYKTLDRKLLDCIKHSAEQSELEDFELQQHQGQLEEEKQLRLDSSRVSFQEQLKVKQFNDTDRLHHQIEEYRSKCTRLEAALAEHSEYQEAAKDLPEISFRNCSCSDHDALLMRLNYAEKRCQAHSQIIVYLRNQLIVATDTNRQLTDDYEKLAIEWHQKGKEWKEKEAQFQREGQSFVEYSIKEQHQYLLTRRGILQLHHDFTKTKDVIKRDLSAMQLQMQHVSQIIPIVLSRFQTLSPTSTLVDTSAFDVEMQLSDQDVSNLKVIKSKFEDEKAVLNERIQELFSMVEQKQSIINEKEGINLALNKTIESLSGRVLSSTSKSADDIDSAIHMCCRALKEIAQQVVEDSERKIWLGFKPMGISDVKKALLSNTRHSVQSLCDNQEFIEGTLAAVKNILKQRSIQFEKLNMQLISDKNKIKTQQKIVENLEEEKKKLSLHISTLESELAIANATVQDFIKDKHKIHATLEETDTQKSWLERMTKTLNDQIESLNSENDRLTQAQTNLYQKIESLQQEQDKLKLSEQTALQDLNRSNKKIIMLESHLEETEKRLQAIQQQLQELSLDKEILEQEHKDLDASLKKLEIQKRKSDDEIVNLQAERDTLKNTVVSLENINESLSQEKVELTHALTESTSEVEIAKSKHLTEKMEYEQENQNLNEKIGMVEGKYSDLEIKMEKVKSDLLSIEDIKTGIEEEKNKVQLERDDLNNQVVKLADQKKVLEEELVQVKQELNFRKESYSKLTREKEYLAGFKSELEIRTESAETELLQQKQVGEALKVEKEGLEKALYASQQLLSALQDQKLELEDELENDKSRVEFIQGQLDDLKKQQELDLETFTHEKDILYKKIQQNEKEQQTILQGERKRHNENVAALTAEKESLRDQFEAAQGELIRQHDIQQDELQQKHEQEFAELKQQMILHEKELQDRMFHSYNEKQKMHSEDQCFSEMVEFQRTIEDLEEKLKDYELKTSESEKDITVSSENYKRQLENLDIEKSKLRDEISSLEIQHEKVVKSLDHRISNLIQEKEDALKNVHELQATFEESKAEKNQLEREIENYMQSADDGKSECQELEQENMSLKQKLNTEKSGREMAEKTYEDLKQRTKKFQVENAELRSVLQDFKQKISALENISGHKNRDSQEILKLLHDVEKARLDERRSSQSLQKRVSTLEAHNESKERELEEVRILMDRDEEIAAELKGEIIKWKQKVMENDASREANLKELNLMRHKLSETEHQYKMLKEEYNAFIQKALSNEQSFVEFRLHLEKSLSEVNDETQMLRVKLSAAEGKVMAYETKIAKLEGSKRDTENKLHSLNLSLRSSLGLGSDSGFQTGSTHLFSTPRSSRRGSPVKFSDSFGSKIKERSPLREHPSSSRDSPTPHSVMLNVTELDVDLVKSAIQDVVNKLCDAEKERDDLKTELMSHERQLEEMKESSGSSYMNLQKVTKEINSVREENKELNNQLSSLKNQMICLEEDLTTLQTEKRQLSEKYANLLQSVSLLESNKGDLEESIFQMRKFNTQLQQEKHMLSEAQDAMESKLFKTVTTLQELELEKMELKDFASGKRSEIETLEHKLQQMNQSLFIMEQKNKTLTTTISSLSSVIESHKARETILHEKVNTLEQSLTTTNFDLQFITKELGTLKGKHANCELEKSNLQSKIENLRSLMTDLQQSNQNLKNRIQTTMDDLKAAEFRKAELEGKIQGYKAILAQNEGLQDAANERVRNLERDKLILDEQLTRLKTALKETEELRLDAEKEKQKTEKEKTHLKKVYERLQTDKSMTEALAGRSVRERSVLGKSLAKMEVENQVLNEKIQALQAKLAESEQRHLEKLKELELKRKLETGLEIERLRVANQQLEQRLHLQGHHNTIVSSLEGQVISLQEQLRIDHHNYQPSSHRLTSISRLHALSSDSLDQGPDSTKQVYAKSFGSNSNIVKTASTSDLSQSAPPKLRQSPSSSEKTSSSNLKVRKRLETMFKP